MIDQQEKAALLPEGETPLQEGWRKLRNNRAARLSLWFIVFFAVISIVGVLVTQGEKALLNPRTVRLADKFKKPFSRVSPALMQLEPEARPFLGIYLLGTDEFGRDVFSRMLEGSSVALLVGIVSVGIAEIIGIVLGSLAGFFGRKKILFFTVDTVIMRAVDILLCFPAFFLILTVIVVLPPSIWNIMVVIGLTSWMGTCRFVRAEFLSLREQDFVTAAHALGLSSRRIMFRHMLPNALAPVLVSANLGIATAILVEASLSFLGFGVPPPQATWGNILSNGKNYLFDAPHLTFIPGAAIFVTVLSFNLLGEGLRDALNPKLS